MSIFYPVINQETWTQIANGPVNRHIYFSEPVSTIKVEYRFWNYNSAGQSNPTFKWIYFPWMFPVDPDYYTELTVGPFTPGLSFTSDKAPVVVNFAKPTNHIILQKVSNGDDAGSGAGQYNSLVVFL